MCKRDVKRITVNKDLTINFLYSACSSIHHSHNGKHAPLLSLAVFHSHVSSAAAQSIQLPSQYEECRPTLLVGPAFFWALGGLQPDLR